MNADPSLLKSSPDFFIGLIVGLQVDEEFAGYSGSPARNRIATTLFAELLHTNLMLDGIAPKQVSGIGFYEASTYVLDVQPGDVRRAGAIIRNILQEYSGASSFQVVEFFADGKPAEIMAEEDLRLFKECFDRAMAAESEIGRDRDGQMRKIRARLSELRKQVNGGEEWKEGEGSK